MTSIFGIHRILLWGRGVGPEVTLTNEHIGGHNTVDLKTVYFKNPGKENTAEVFAIARRRATELGIKTIVVASTTGWTATQAAKRPQWLQNNSGHAL